MILSIVLLLFGVLLAIASQLLLAFCVYNDGRSRGDNNATLFAVLTGVLGFIPAIIYLILRATSSSGKAALICPQCGVILPTGAYNCPNCGMPHPNAVYLPPDAAVRSHRAKGLLIGWIVCLVVSIIVLVAGFVTMAMSTFSYFQEYTGPGQYYSYDYNQNNPLDDYLNEYYY